MFFKELQEKVIGLWNALPGGKGAYEEHHFSNFVNGYKYDIPEHPAVQFIEQDGGGEGGAEDCYSIIKVEGVFYEITYSYYSHHGFEYGDVGVREVHPKEKTITVYE